MFTIGEKIKLNRDEYNSFRDKYLTIWDDGFGNRGLTRMDENVIKDIIKSTEITTDADTYTVKEVFIDELTLEEEPDGIYPFFLFEKL